MPGKPITLTEAEYLALSQGKEAYETARGARADWGIFVMFLLGLYIKREVARRSQKERGTKPKRGG